MQKDDAVTEDEVLAWLSRPKLSTPLETAVSYMTDMLNGIEHAASLKIDVLSFRGEVQ